MSTEQRPIVDVSMAAVRGSVRSPSAGRSAAFQELTNHQLLASYRLANAILADPTEAEDAVHDAVVVAWRRWDNLRDHARFEAWFQRIVVNTCRDRLRRTARSRTRDINLEPGLVISDRIHEIDDRVIVEQALGRLEPDDRVVLALRHYRDLKIDDIARLLDVPRSTANSRLRTARSRLRAALEDAGLSRGER